MERQLDVSHLEPCEPLERTLEAIQTLQPGDYLRVIHRREPHLLYPLLDKGGFSWHTRPGDGPAWEIFIWQRGDTEAEAQLPERVDC
jgi:uncharacterized protein (DUF2249 family)